MCVVFFFKQKTAYEMRISDWSSDVCSSDLAARLAAALEEAVGDQRILANARHGAAGAAHADRPILEDRMIVAGAGRATHEGDVAAQPRSEEHTSELPSLMRISYAVFCLKKKNNQLSRPITT